MAFFRDLKRAVQTTLLPCVFVGVGVYFVANAIDGERGTRAAAQRREVLAGKRVDLARAEAERAIWERRTAALHINRLEVDMLDERARAMLNLSEQDDVIVQYGPKERLF